jgi:hypothetical protein
MNWQAVIYELRHEADRAAQLSVGFGDIQRAAHAQSCTLRAIANALQMGLNKRNEEGQ